MVNLRHCSELFFGCEPINDNPARLLAAKRELCLGSLLRVKSQADGTRGSLQ